MKTLEHERFLKCGFKKTPECIKNILPLYVYTKFNETSQFKKTNLKDKEVKEFLVDIFSKNTLNIENLKIVNSLK